MTYTEKLRDPRWQRKRLRIMSRDRWACRDCHATEKTLHVHHCHYAKGEPWETADQFLMTLCNDCHVERQAKEDAGKQALALIFARLDVAQLERLTGELALLASSPESMPTARDWWTTPDGLQAAEDAKALELILSEERAEVSHAK